MNKFKEMLMKDFLWKLLSLAIAVILWFVVINLENPVETRNFTALLQIKNESVITERGQTISNYDEIAGRKITIKIRGQRLSLDRLYKNRADIQAYIDLSLLDEQDGMGEPVPCAVTVKLPSNLSDVYQIESRTPSSVNVSIENVISSEKNISLDIVGSADSGRTMAQPELGTQTASVRGTQSKVDSVSKVTASVNVENIKEDTTIVSSLAAYDSAGNIVEGVEISPPSVEVYIPVKMSKRVELRADVSGTPISGYSLENIEIVPDHIYILGDEEILNGIDYIELPDVNIDGRGSDFSMTYAMKYFLPEGVKLMTSRQNMDVTINANFSENIERTAVVKSDNISFYVELEDGLIAEVAPGDISFAVTGTESAVSQLDGMELTGSVSITDLSEGTYRIPLNVELPEGVEIVDKNEVIVSVTVVKSGDDEPAEETPEEPVDEEPPAETEEPA